MASLSFAVLPLLSATAPQQRAFNVNINPLAIRKKPMKNLFLRRCCWHLLHLIALCTPLWAQATDITITYADYKPYSFEAAGQAQGLEIELLNEALGKRMGLTLIHKILPWERAQQMVQVGAADAFIATLTPERAKYAAASREPLTFWELSLYFRKGDRRFNNIKTLADLAPFKIGSLQGNGWVKKNLSGMNIEYVNKMPLLPKMLQLGRIDVIPDNRLVMQDLLSANEAAAQIEERPLDFTRNSMHLQVAKTSALHARLTEFDSVLLEMKKDGSWQRIHDRYKGKIR